MQKRSGKKTKDRSGISGHGFICFCSGMVSDEERHMLINHIIQEETNILKMDI